MTTNKWENLAYRKVAFRKVEQYCLDRFGPPSGHRSVRQCIMLFAHAEGFQIEGNPKKWIVDLYRSGENEFIQRCDLGFYLSKEWIDLRNEVIQEYGRTCMRCGTTEGRSFHVDHIQPRSKFPELSLEKSNLQVLCQACNCSKQDKDQTDYRLEKDGSQARQGHRRDPGARLPATEHPGPEHGPQP